ncbi:type IV pilus modification protein PilV [Thalassotalea sp. G2M2-11]|uniref:type IV pilus modification protein PilV n=1 Tax=Thalassotalea sp. G2M2-11 TaxID=2787627 RepID=UPI0019D2C487|nr:type IV pilus modification protein PilV [Thalassotalea sp. G2M2-11]
MKQGYSQQSKGMTFIEVLVALVIIVTGILGAVAMQATAKKASFDAMQRSLASSLAQDMIERMRGNDPAILGNYNGTDYGETLDAEPSNRCNTSAGCVAADLVTNDKYEWELALMGADVQSSGSNAGGLVGARGCISHSLGAVTVIVSWQGRDEIADSDKGTCGAAGKKRRQVIVQAFVI